MCIYFKKKLVLHENIIKLQEIWEETSFRLELLQTNNKCVQEEKNSISTQKKMTYTVSHTILDSINKIPSIPRLIKEPPKVAIIRTEGSNGDREMASAFYAVGFEVWDIMMTDFKVHSNILSKFRGIAFVGGFSFSDVFGAAQGWYKTIINNKRIYNEFEIFYNRQDTFSLGVCNGCQLMSKLNWIPKCRLEKNDSGRFESRFSTVKIIPSNSIMLKDMENSILGIWVAHGEGKFVLEKQKKQEKQEKQKKQEKQEKQEKQTNVIRYVDDEENITIKYPFNPNGSEEGIAGICSENGRHLAMMPHPERCFRLWQMAWYPKEWNRMNKRNKISNINSPWLYMFYNAYMWCIKNI